MTDEAYWRLVALLAFICGVALGVTVAVLVGC